VAFFQTLGFCTGRMDGLARSVLRRPHNNIKQTNKKQTDVET